MIARRSGSLGRNNMVTVGWRERERDSGDRKRSWETLNT